MHIYINKKKAKKTESDKPCCLALLPEKLIKVINAHKPKSITNSTARVTISVSSALGKLQVGMMRVRMMTSWLRRPILTTTAAAFCVGLATVSRLDKTEILALGSLPKWPRRCSAAEGTAACGARGRPPGLAFFGYGFFGYRS